LVFRNLNLVTSESRSRFTKKTGSGTSQSGSKTLDKKVKLMVNAQHYN
jgi:hypothetical protein